MQLKQEQRIKIDVYLRERKTITEISEILGYSYQTILREINNRSILVYNSKVIKYIHLILKNKKQIFFKPYILYIKIYFYFIFFSQHY